MRLQNATRCRSSADRVAPSRVQSAYITPRFFPSAEIGIALVFLAFGALVIFDSVRQGARWLADGPQPGYFPFYLGVIICVASAVTLVRGVLLPAEQNKTFVQVGQAKLVLSVLVPSAIYVALVGYIGIYVSAVLFVALFMRWLGKYPWWKIVAVAKPPRPSEIV